MLVPAASAPSCTTSLLVEKRVTGFADLARAVLALTETSLWQRNQYWQIVKSKNDI